MNNKIKFDKENDAPILIVFGQSNAHGHGTRLPDKEKILSPLKNVMGLCREYNQSYNLKDVVWTGYTSFGMNLGETQDHTYCLATEFARKWQNHIDVGNAKNLPDLYIIQISIGGQGIAEYEKFGNMWYMNRKRVLKPGDLSVVDISLYPLAVQILEAAMQSLRSRLKKPQILGLHWNQWETEVDTGGRSVTEAKKSYVELFNGFREAIGLKFRICLYRPLSGVYNNPQGIAEISNVFNELAEDEDSYRIIDISASELWDESKSDKGIFLDDLVHYNKDAQIWFAEYYYNLLFED